MPTVTKVNPILRNESRSFNGKTVTALTVNAKDTDDNAVDISGSLGPDGAVQEILQGVTERATLVLHSKAYDGAGTGDQIDVFVEGEFPTDFYDGTNEETFATYVQSVLQALGTVDSIDLTGTTVTEDGASPFFADDVPVSR
jgi:hypothetical protein